MLGIRKCEVHKHDQQRIIQNHWEMPISFQVRQYQLKFICHSPLMSNNKQATNTYHTLFHIIFNHHHQKNVPTHGYINKSLRTQRLRKRQNSLARKLVKMQ